MAMMRESLFLIREVNFAILTSSNAAPVAMWVFKSSKQYLLFELESRLRVSNDEL